MAGQPEQPLFTFITDDALRASLEKDYDELTKAVQDGLWKSALVLAGSIIEAALIDCLIALEYKHLPDDKILEFALAQAIDACKGEGLLTTETVGLCTVIRQYRNLIHPGRFKRLSMKIDKNGATMSLSLVNIVVVEVAAKKQDLYGYTSERIVEKLKIDPGTSVLLSLLRTMKPRELDRLAFNVLPKELIASLTRYENEGELALRRALGRCFRSVLDLAPELRNKAATTYLDLLKRGTRPQIDAFDKYFITVAYLNYATPEQVLEIKPHLLDAMAARCRNIHEIHWGVPPTE
jgi:hypothetical protein